MGDNGTVNQLASRPHVEPRRQKEGPMIESTFEAVPGKKWATAGKKWA